MKLKETAEYSVVAGFIITLLSVLYPIKGAPWPWIEGSRIIFSTFIIDVIIWSIVTMLGYILFEELR